MPLQDDVGIKVTLTGSVGVSDPNIKQGGRSTLPESSTANVCSVLGRCLFTSILVLGVVLTLGDDWFVRDGT
jgi:hypothetical protein